MSLPLVFSPTTNASWNVKRPLWSRESALTGVKVLYNGKSSQTNVVQYKRSRAHGRRPVTAHADGEKDKLNAGSSHNHERHHHVVRPEVHGFRMRPGRPIIQGPDQNVILQGFNWESWKHKWWATLTTKVEDLCSVGITDVWLPPPSQSVDRQGYLPSQLYDLDGSEYGTAAQLKELIDECHRHNICCVADIVINHRSGINQDSKGHWNVFKGGNRDRRLDWGPWAVVDDDVYDSGGKGNHDTGESYGAAPDLDHTNKQVQDELTDWMNWLRAEIGFDGWRFDFVKGYHPSFTKLYIDRTKPTLAVGELWTSMDYFDGQLSWDQNRHRQVLCNWIDGTGGTCCAFDFTTKGILQRAVEGELWRLRDDNNKPPGLIGWYPQRAVTFIDNHDTGSTQRHWNFPDARVLMGYVYILTHPGIPCIFIDHLYEFKLKEEIKKLVLLRKRNRINARSKICILKAEADIYVARIEDRVIVKLGARMEMGGLLPNKKEWSMYMAGRDFAIWETTRALPVVPEVHQEEHIPPVQKFAEKSVSSHPVHLTSKMSEETKKRILKEVSHDRVVDPVEEEGM
ncbi:hypothetical protein R1sor_018789 [Riccia sorocarpa]|uniref:alpha-amylase n=1 Tax=Riccia sorocarpa TaxID=122646 RepID=A0ABD3IEW1_9MARC